jgi:N-succinyldiaminopimelate aminotransferase
VDSGFGAAIEATVERMGTPYLNDKLQGFGTSIFAEMSALAVATNSINLGQGFPDTDGPSEILEAAISAIREGRGNQYPPGLGIPELRLAIADHQRRFYGIDLDPEREVLVTAGATEAISATLLSLLNIGDECIVFEPFYDSYTACVAMSGARFVPVTLRAPDFGIDPDELRDAITPQTKMIILNSPHNPTGTVLGREQLQMIADAAIEHDLLVLADEAYEHLTFDGAVHIPISTLPGMAERTLTVGSAGKTFSFTGWKVGWVTASPELVTAVRTAKQFLTYVASGPFQYAIARGLALDDAYFTGFASELQAKRDLLMAGLKSAGFRAFKPRGTYFITTDISGLTDDDALSFCRSLPERCGVVAVPNSVFYVRRNEGHSFVRFAFCKRDEIIHDAAERLRGMTR